MNSDDKIEILKQREYLVVKGNDLIQKNRFELSLREQKTVAFICSLIKPTIAAGMDINIPYQLEYDFKIRDYCKVCGIDCRSGKHYAEIKATLKGLRDRSMWLTLEDGSETLVGWLSKVTLNKKSGFIHLCVDEQLAPYLFDLKQKFTQYQLYNILAMKSAFSVRVYELLKSYEFQKQKVFELDELKHLLMVDEVKSYERFPDFRRKVLERAVTEINELTDLDVGYDPITKGRKVIKIQFNIRLKSPIGRLISGTTANERLDALK